MKKLNVLESIIFIILAICFVGILISGIWRGLKRDPLPIIPTEEDYIEWEKEEAVSTGKRVTATVYNPVESQCDSSPLVTADNSYIDLKKLNRGKIKWIAVSPDLLDEFPYGSKIYLACEDEEVSGVYYVHDTMNKRWRNRIDILMPPTRSTGKWKATIEILPEI